MVNYGINDSALDDDLEARIIECGLENVLDAIREALASVSNRCQLDGAVKAVRFCAKELHVNLSAAEEDLLVQYAESYFRHNQNKLLVDKRVLPTDQGIHESASKHAFMVAARDSALTKMLGNLSSGLLTVGSVNGVYGACYVIGKLADHFAENDLVRQPDKVRAWAGAYAGSVSKQTKVKIPAALSAAMGR